MKLRIAWGLTLLAFCLALTIATPLQGQQAAQKAPTYMYVAEWAVPRAQWAEIDKVADQDRPVLDKLIADGTLTGYGAYSNLLHAEGAPTHGTWFTASSEGKLLKALEVIYAQPALVGAAVQGASKHWDFLLTSTMYNAKPGASAGYLTYSRWEIKPGEGRAYSELNKKVIMPVLEKLLAEGTITSYGSMTEDYHTEKIGAVFDYFTVPDAASLDKANKALEDLFDTPGLGDAFRAVTSPEGHRDYLTKIRFMNNK